MPLTTQNGYEKLQMKHQRHEDQLDDQEVRPVEKELKDQTEDGEIALLRREIEEIKEQLQDRMQMMI